MPIFKYTLLASLTFIFLSNMVVFAQDTVSNDPPPIFSAIKSGKVQNIRLSSKADIQRFYTENEGQFLWVKNRRYTSNTRDVFKIIQESYEHGLNPDNYHRALLAPIMRGTFPEELSDSDAELLMNDAVVRFGSDLTGMRVSAKSIEADYASWSQGISAYALLTLLRNASDPEQILMRLSPQDDTYKALQKELKRVLDEYAEKKGSQNQRLSFSGILYPGQQSEIIPQLRQRFHLKNPSQDNFVYDENLEQAILNFQKSRGLKADAVIGPRTMIALNEGLRERLIKILANLERRRWVKRPLPHRYIEVNIPAMWLRAVDQNKPVFDMPVIIGRKKRQTISFVDEIVGIRFNPSWYVPDTIKKEDYLPKLQENPQALAEKGIAFRIKDSETGSMVTVLPEDVEWDKVTQQDLKSIQMVQGPGAANALGQVRVLMPNRYDIYLHDTNAPDLFQKDDRAQSSGCVRLSEPHRIANFILGKNRMWSEDRLDAYLKKGKTLEIGAEQTTPVFLYYFTIWQDENGKLIFGNDIYGQDELLVKVLKSNNQVNFPLI